ncbi:hypothetical protein AHiyo6_06990, partial [Arthrobacter sp. Hiyo6]
MKKEIMNTLEPKPGPPQVLDVIV